MESTIEIKDIPCAHFNRAPLHLRGSPDYRCVRQQRFNGPCKFVHKPFCNNPECVAFQDRKDPTNPLHHTMHTREKCPRADSLHSPSTNSVVVLRETVAQRNPAPILSARGGFRPQSHLMVGGGGGMGQENSEGLFSSDWRAKPAQREQEEEHRVLDDFDMASYREICDSYGLPHFSAIVRAICDMFMEEEGRGLRDLEALIGERPYPISLMALEICTHVSPDRHEELLANRPALQEMVLNICIDEASPHPSRKNTDKG